MFIIPTMDEYFRLARNDRRRLTVSAKVLKDYGVMKCIEFISELRATKNRPLRILEMGHGFAPDVLRHFQGTDEVWGVDDDQGLHYFKNIDWDERFQREVLAHCPNVKFVRGLVGSETHPAGLPEGYFDVILSISILEEVPQELFQKIIPHAARLLAPGGWLIGTHDLAGRMLPGRYKAYREAHEQCGLVIDGAPEPEDIERLIDWQQVVLENPLSVLLYYQGHIAEEERKYWGHFTTMFTAARQARDAAES